MNKQTAKKPIRKKHEPKFKKQEKKHCDICHGEGYDCHPNPCCKSLGLKHSPIVTR